MEYCNFCGKNTWTGAVITVVTFYNRFRNFVPAHGSMDNFRWIIAEHKRIFVSHNSTIVWFSRNFVYNSESPRHFSSLGLIFSPSHKTALLQGLFSQSRQKKLVTEFFAGKGSTARNDLVIREARRTQNFGLPGEQSSFRTDISCLKRRHGPYPTSEVPLICHPFSGKKRKEEK